MTKYLSMFLPVLFILIFAGCDSPNAKQQEEIRQAQITSLTDEINKLEGEKQGFVNQFNKAKENQGWLRNNVWFNSKEVSDLKTQIAYYDKTLETKKEELRQVRAKYDGKDDKIGYIIIGVIIASFGSFVTVKTFF